MAQHIRDDYTERNGKVTFVMEWLWRLITVLLVPVIVYMMSQIVAIQATLADNKARLSAVELKTSMQPPMDYRSYIDEKFRAVATQLAEIKADLQAHMQRSRVP